MSSNNFCVIMAGGIGSRFWPLSTSEYPKQFLDILGTGRTLLQQTFDRFRKQFSVENFLVVTSEKYKSLVLEQIPEINEDQILCEPIRRNTAPCIAYAAYKIKAKFGEKANMVVAPSDHLILNEIEFNSEISKGLDFVSGNDVLLTLGIQPNRPETGYGYIQIKDSTAYKNYTNLHSVKTFTEKPNTEMAKVFIETGEFFWNSGIFIWSVDTIIDAFQKHLVDIHTLFVGGNSYYNNKGEKGFINKTYSECPNISIDYGIMEKATNVYVLTSDFGWSDLGTWGSLYDNIAKDEQANALSSTNIHTYDSKNCIVKLPNNKTAVIQGLDDYIVAESNNVLLICQKEEEQQIRHFVADIELNKEK